MKKKILSLALVVAMVALVAAGSMAYFTDETDTITNTMTVGDVEITQSEWMRNPEGGTTLITYVDQPLVPAVIHNANSELVATGSNGWWYGSKVYEEKIGTTYSYTDLAANNHFQLSDADRIANVVDKIVSVKNTGNEAAYVRTIVMFEDDASWNVANNLDFVYNQNVAMKMETMNVASTNYVVLTFTYADALEAGEVSLPSLMGFWMNPECTETTAAAINNKEILVLSQAVQADGFKTVDEAFTATFGTVDATKLADWKN